MPRPGTRLSILVALSALLGPAAAVADNGSLAYAVPVTGIVVDGDLSDWPAGMEVHRMRWNPEPYGETDLRGVDLDTSPDLSPQFSVAWDSLEQLIYVAVRVRDDEVIVGGTTISTDACEIYLAAPGQMPNQLLLCPPGGSYGDIEPPRVASMHGFASLVDSRSRTAVERRQDTTIYEVALDPDLLLPPGHRRLHTGVSLSFDVVAVDKDDDGLSAAKVSWGHDLAGFRVATPGSLGDLHLVAAPPTLHAVAGTVTSDAGPIGGLAVLARSPAGLVREVRTDTTGAFRLRLSPGRWQLETAPAQSIVPVSRSIEVGDDQPQPVHIEVHQLASRFLARLVVPIDPARHRAFESAFEQELLPALRRRGWVPSVDHARPVADSLFCRLFELRTVAGIVHARAALWDRTDTSLSRLLTTLGDRFGTRREDGRLGGDLHLYATPPVDDLLSLQLDVRSRHQDEPPLGQRMELGPEVSVPAQETRTAAGPGLHRGSWRTFTARDGVPHNRVGPTRRDPAGHLWFTVRSAASSGIVRYDGRWFTSWVRPDSPDPFTWDVLPTPDGVVWMATNDGLVRFDGRRFTTFPHAEILSDRIYDLALGHDGALWIGARRGLGRLEGESLTVYTAADGLMGGEIWATSIGPRGSLWITSAGEDLSRFDGERFQRLRRAGVTGRSWTSTPAGWFSSTTGWARFDGERFEIFGVADGFPELERRRFPEPTAFQIDGQGAYWFGSALVFRVGGLRRLADGRVTEFTAADGLTNTGDLQADEHGVWAVGLSGLSRYEEPRFETFRVADGLADDKVIRLLEADDGKIWIATGRGVSVYDDGAFRAVSIHAAIDTSEVRDIAQDRRGHIWFGAHNINGPAGAVRWDGRRAYRMTTEDGLGSNWIASIAEDSAGDLWFATPRVGVTRYDGERFTVYTAEGDLGLSAENAGVWRILERQAGDLWFSTWFHGIRRFDGERFTALTREQGLISDQVWPLYKDRRGRMWIGTRNAGVTVYDDGRFVDSLTTEDGLTNSAVRAILEDRHGHMWVGTYGGGVTRFDGDVVQYLDSRNGLANDVVYDLLEDRRGDIWIATRAGLTRFHPARSPPTVAITRVVADEIFASTDDIAVPSTEPRVALEFEAAVSASSQGLVYQYRLLGHEEGWSTTREQQVAYYDLPIGAYRFELRAVDDDNLDRSETVAVDIEIHPPYARLAALAGAALAVLVILGQAVRIVRRGRRLAEANTELTRAHRALQESQAQLVQSEKMATLGLLAGGVAHEINNPLQTVLDGAGRILAYPDDRDRHVESADLIAQAARRCSSVVQSLLGFARSGRRAGEPVDVNEVVDTTVALIAGQFRSAGVELVVEPGEHVVAEGDFGDLCTVVTNLLVNARDAASSGSHAEGDRPTVRVRTVREADRVRLHVRDNGPGLPPELRERIFDPFFTTKDVGEGSGLGLAIVRTLLERHGGAIGVTSEAGRGAVFTVELPASG